MKQPLSDEDQAQIEVNRNCLISILYAICLPWAIGYWIFRWLDWLFGA